MEDFYINSTSQNQSNDYNITSNYQNYSNITTEVDKVNLIMHVLTYIIIGVGLPLTLVAIYALCSMVRSDHVAPIFVINLLISDLIQLCCLIVYVAQPVDKTMYNIFSCIYHSGLFASIYFMVCIALERYLVIVHPLWYRFRRTIKTSVVVFALVWALTFVFVVLYYVFNFDVVRSIIFTVLLLLPFPLLIFFLVGALKALSASISVPSDEKRRIVGVLVLVLLIYTLLFLPSIIGLLGVKYDKTLDILSHINVKLSPLADLILYVFMRRGAIDRFLASVCCCRITSNDISISSV